MVAPAAPWGERLKQLTAEPTCGRQAIVRWLGCQSGPEHLPACSRAFESCCERVRTGTAGVDAGLRGSSASQCRCASSATRARPVGWYQNLYDAPYCTGCLCTNPILYGCLFVCILRFCLSCVRQWHLWGAVGSRPKSRDAITLRPLGGRGKGCGLKIEIFRR